MAVADLKIRGVAIAVSQRSREPGATPRTPEECAKLAPRQEVVSPRDTLDVAAKRAESSGVGDVPAAGATARGEPPSVNPPHSRTRQRRRARAAAKNAAAATRDTLRAPRGRQPVGVAALAALSASRAWDAACIAHSRERPSTLRTIAASPSARFRRRNANRKPRCWAKRPPAGW